MYSWVGRFVPRCGIEGVVDLQFRGDADVPMVFSFLWLHKGRHFGI